MVGDHSSEKIIETLFSSLIFFIFLLKRYQVQYPSPDSDPLPAVSGSRNQKTDAFVVVDQKV